MKTKYLILIGIICIVLIGSGYFLLSHKNTEDIIVRYNKIVPDYEPKDIVIKEQKYQDLFKAMIDSAVEQSRESNPSPKNIFDVKCGSYIFFKKDNQDTKIEYFLQGQNLKVDIYNDYTQTKASISESISYTVSEEYYDQWIEFCSTHS